MSDIDVPEFIAELERRDADIGDPITTAFREVRADGALSMKTKTLIVMALDAALGHPHGVASLAQTAREQGASDDEILEVLEVVTMTCGIQALGTGTHAFDEWE